MDFTTIGINGAAGVAGGLFGAGAALGAAPFVSRLTQTMTKSAAGPWHRFGAAATGTVLLGLASGAAGGAGGFLGGGVAGELTGQSQWRWKDFQTGVLTGVLGEVIGGASRTVHVAAMHEPAMPAVLVTEHSRGIDVRVNGTADATAVRRAVAEAVANSWVDGRDSRAGAVVEQVVAGLLPTDAPVAVWVSAHGPDLGSIAGVYHGNALVGEISKGSETLGGAYEVRFTAHRPETAALVVDAMIGNWQAAAEVTRSVYASWDATESRAVHLISEGAPGNQSLLVHVEGATAIPTYQQHTSPAPAPGTTLTGLRTLDVPVLPHDPENAYLPGLLDYPVTDRAIVRELNDQLREAGGGRLVATDVSTPSAQVRLLQAHVRHEPTELLAMPFAEAAGIRVNPDPTGGATISVAIPDGRPDSRALAELAIGDREPNLRTDYQVTPFTGEDLLPANRPATQREWLAGLANRLRDDASATHWVGVQTQTSFDSSGALVHTVVAGAAGAHPVGSGVTIRPMRPDEDLTIVQEVDAICLGDLPAPLSVFRRWAEGGYLFVAELDGKSIGYASAVRDRAGTAHMQGLAVLPGYREHRVGWNLKNFSQQRLAQDGVERFEAVCKVDNFAMHRINERLGYERQGVAPRYYGEDGDRLVWSLGAPDPESTPMRDYVDADHAVVTAPQEPDFAVLSDIDPTVDHWLLRQWHEQGYLMVATQHGDPVGFVVTGVDGDGRNARLVHIAVKDPANVAVGETLMRAAARQLSDDGVRRLDATVVPGTPAARYAEALGMAPYTARRHWHDHFVDAVRMSLSLSQTHDERIAAITAGNREASLDPVELERRYANVEAAHRRGGLDYSRAQFDSVIDAAREGRTILITASDSPEVSAALRRALRDTAPEIDTRIVFESPPDPEILASDLVPRSGKIDHHWYVVTDASLAVSARALAETVTVDGYIHDQQGSDRLVFVNPGAANALHKQFEIRGADGTWSPEFLEAAKYHDLLSRSPGSVAVVPVLNSRTVQQDRAWEILRVLGYTGDRFHNLIIDPSHAPGDLAADARALVADHA